MHNIEGFLFDKEVDAMNCVQFYQYVKRQTQSGAAAKIFYPNKYLLGRYDKANKRHIRYLDCANDPFKQRRAVFLGILRSLEGDINVIKKIREVLVKYLVCNDLEPHEQVLFFNNDRYRDRMYDSLTAIDSILS